MVVFYKLVSALRERDLNVDSIPKCPKAGKFASLS